MSSQAKGNGFPGDNVDLLRNLSEVWRGFWETRHSLQMQPQGQQSFPKGNNISGKDTSSFGHLILRVYKNTFLGREVLVIPQRVR